MKDVRDYSDMGCPMHGLLSLLTGPWTAYILWLLYEHGPMRFGQLRKQIPGISAKVLTERLRMLEGADILSRHQEPTIPPKVTYRFTSRGDELHRLLVEVHKLAQAWTRVKPLPRKKPRRSS